MASCRLYGTGTVPSIWHLSVHRCYRQIPDRRHGRILDGRQLPVDVCLACDWAAFVRQKMPDRCRGQIPDGEQLSVAFRMALGERALVRQSPGPTARADPRRTAMSSCRPSGIWTSGLGKASSRMDGASGSRTEGNCELLSVWRLAERQWSGNVPDGRCFIAPWCRQTPDNDDAFDRHTLHRLHRFRHITHYIIICDDDDADVVASQCRQHDQPSVASHHDRRCHLYTCS